MVSHLVREVADQRAQDLDRHLRGGHLARHADLLIVAEDVADGLRGRVSWTEQTEQRRGADAPVAR